ncbi:MAG TPA: PAS domain S-box protein [Xanthobacteraceae bacterium]|nr:PAS domain S-box protein [Xanthobacteraceae bacterium]
MVWTNAAGAALFGATDVAALEGRAISESDPLAAEIGRLGATLPRAEAPRLEPLRGMGEGTGRRLTCACSWFALGATSGLLIVATEAVGRPLPMADRVRRLFAGLAAPLAVFGPSGALLYGSTAAAAHLGSALTLAALGVDPLGVEARRVGRARGTTLGGPIEIERLGTEGALLTLFEAADAPGALAGAAPLMQDMRPASEAPAPFPQAGEAARIKDYRRLLRFVWQMEPDGSFTLGSEEFATAMGARTMALVGAPWTDIARELGLDPERRVEQAVASRDTWSGIVVQWPIDALSERIPVELSGLPVFDRDRQFRGYRGFGVCREVARLEALGRVGVLPPLTAVPPSNAPVTRPETGATRRADAGHLPAGPATESRPQLTLVPAAKNVVPFRAVGSSNGDKRGPLSPVERPALRDIGKAPEPPEAPDSPRLAPLTPEPTKESRRRDFSASDLGAPGLMPDSVPIPSAFAPHVAAPPLAPPLASAGPTLDRLPMAVVVYRGNQLIYANRTLLDWTGYEDLEAIEAGRGLEGLFVEPNPATPAKLRDGGQALAIATRSGEALAVEARLFTVGWDGASASMLVLIRAAGEERLKGSDRSMRELQTQARELRSILDTATDGVVVVERDGRIGSLNRSAEALFGYEAHELSGRPFVDLFAPESHRAALDYLDGLALNGVASVLNDGREVIGRVRQGGLIPLFMTMGRIAEGTEKFCAVFRDITQWKRAEEDLLNAKRQAERASSAKSDFLAKISHEIRTPLNAIIGFSEVMMDESFGPIGIERYREYLRDIHASGGHLISLINDLLDLSKIEAGKLDLTFTSVNLNELVRQCVAMMQPQANQQRIIIRTSLSPTLPPVVVDARSIRQIVLNLLSNSIKFTTAGGQVIVSTALTERGEAVLRVRDTGIGMSEKEIETALEPFRQLATSTRWGSGGTGLGLPLTKALAEANRATFSIKSAVNAGTLVEITFPSTRVLAE